MDQRIPRTDDEHIAVLKLWFLNNPDPMFAQSLDLIRESALMREAVKRKLNKARILSGLPMITDRQFQRLFALLYAGTHDA
jgi:hypothetical protein